MKLFWLSFCDSDKPKGTQFLGCVIIEAPDLVDAITKSHGLGVNPGGEVLSIEIPDEVRDRFGPEHRDKLLSREYVDEHLGGARQWGA